MKNYVVALSLACICLSLFNLDAYGQSRRGGKKNTKKANQHEKIDDKTTGQKPRFTNEDKSEIIEILETDDDILNIDTTLVTIPVRVLDRNGRFVSGLKREDFKVFEDKKQEEIAYFTNEQKPFTVALVLDMSYSSTFKIDEIQQAALQFVTELRPNDRVMVLSFDEELHVLCEPTNDRTIINSAIVKTRISTGTSLYEAVDFVINKRLNKIDGRKAIVLFTDGVDTTSRQTNDLGNINAARELDALIYPIHYDTFADVQAIENGKIKINAPNNLPQMPPPIGGGNIPATIRKKSPFPFPLPTGNVGGGGVSQPIAMPGSGTTRKEYDHGKRYLDEMALRTGGRLYEAKSASGLTRAFSKIASELREYYSLGYYPSEEKKEGKKRKIKVRVNRNKVAVKARTSYIVKKKL